MRTPDVQRQRRSRAHRRGEHALCDPSKCDGYTPPVVEGPLELGPRGKSLKRELLALGEPAPGDRILIEEACRLADRLDVLARILRGEDHPWLVIQIDLRKNLLGEARQQALALRQILEKLQGKRGAGEREQPEGNPLDELATRRAQRLADAKSSEVPAL
jgi:hypothetical protein